jgi:PAS domain S-box-containing protein
MEAPLQVLILEDRASDAEFLLHELNRAGIAVNWQRVETEEDFLGCLEPAPDIILADYSMPQFDAPRALEILHEKDLDIPFIIVSGTISEDVAVTSMKAGASDFFTKSKLTRLVPAIERELREAKERRKRREAEKNLQRSHQRLKTLHAIDQAILTAQSAEAVARLALQYFLQQVSIPGASIVAFDFESHEGLVFASPVGSGDLLSADTRFPLSEWQPEDLAALRTGAIQVIEDAAAIPQLPPGIGVLQKNGLRTFLRVPLIAQGALLGILILGAERLDAITSEYRESAREVASQVAIAIQQSRLRDQIQRHALDLEQRVVERTAELRRTKERVEAILNNSSDAILFLTFDGVIQQVNPAFSALFGYSSEDIFRQSVLTLARQDNSDTLLDALSVTVNTGQPSRADFLAARKDDSLFYADMALAAIREDDKVRGLVCSVRDITERKRAEQELREALEKERELNELKSRFVSIVSHEFRTPLTTILSSSQLVKRYRDRLSEERQIGYLDKIETQVYRLTELLEDVLTLSKAEAVGFQFNPEPLDLETFCRSLVEEIQAITNTPHRMVFSTSGSCDGFSGDEKLLRHIVTNLLTNAIKYSPQGGSVQLTLACEDRHAVLHIKDEGLGIPEEDQKHLFEPFHRAKNVGSISGTGLGLPIVKRAVDAHGGSITVDSQVGSGTTFSVRLPLVLP